MLRNMKPETPVTIVTCVPAATTGDTESSLTVLAEDERDSRWGWCECSPSLSKVVLTKLCGLYRHLTNCRGNTCSRWERWHRFTFPSPIEAAPAPGPPTTDEHTWENNVFSSTKEQNNESGYEILDVFLLRPSQFNNCSIYRFSLSQRNLLCVCVNQSKPSSYANCQRP